MEWIALVTVILQLLRPILQAWLENLLKRAAADLEARGAALAGYASAEAEGLLWDSASAILEAQHRQGSWWDWLPIVMRIREVKNQRQRAYFEAARKVALARAGQCYEAAFHPTLGVEPLTSDEIKEIQQEG